MRLQSWWAQRTVVWTAWVVAVGWSVAGISCNAAVGQERLPQVVRVTETYDQRPFEYRIEARVERPNYVVLRLTYPSPVTTSVPQNNTIPAVYYLPKGIKPDDPKRPAVICLHILDGNEELTRMNCAALASHGIPAIAFKLPYYGERGLIAGPRALAQKPQLLVEALAQGMHDIRRTVDLLASRPEVNPTRIGIMGISLGAIAAGTAAGQEPRLWRTMMILGGGDVLTMIHHARETRALSLFLRSLTPEDRGGLEKTIQAVDPLRHAAALRDRALAGRVLMVNAAEDEVIPKACTEKLAAALGISDRVEWLQGLGHYTTLAALPRVMQRMVDFFAEDLAPGLRVAPPPPDDRAPAQVVLSLIQQALGFLVTEPIEGRGHYAELAVSVVLKEQKAYEGRLLLVRGARGRFKLQCRVPMLGEIAIGQGRYPWMVSSGKKVFKGVKGLTDPPGDPLALAHPDHMLRIRMLAGAVAGAALAPEILEPWVALAEERVGGPGRVIRLAPRQRIGGTGRLVFQPDGKTPKELAYEAPGVRVQVQFLQWQPNTITPEALYDPPPGIAEQQEVGAAELHRIFAALFNFAMESL